MANKEETLKRYKPVHGLNKIPDWELLKLSRQEIGELKSLLAEREDELKRLKNGAGDVQKLRAELSTVTKERNEYKRKFATAEKKWNEYKTLSRQARLEVRKEEMRQVQLKQISDMQEKIRNQAETITKLQSELLKLKEQKNE